MSTLVCLLLIPAAVEAQPRERPLPRPERPTAYLVTIGPGDAIWERFGHNLIWIHDPDSGTDEGYNYGLFSFEQEGFVVRFILGHMRYWMDGLDVGFQLRAYARENRPIWIQELALDPARVRELHAFLEWNERPENRYYRYDYYRDNCSTRVRDALDRVLGGRLRAWAAGRPTPATYRDHTLRQTAGLFWASAGMHFGLGPSADRPLSAWEAMFIPMELQAHLRDFVVQVEDGGDAAVPLVRAEWTHFEADRAPTPDETPRWILGFLVVGLGLAGLIVGLGRLAERGHRGARIGLAALAVAWSGMIALLGLLVAFLWGLTDHVYTRANLNLAHATPLPALAVAAWLLAGRRPRTAPWVPPLAAAIVGLTVVGLLAEALPGRGQVNGEFIALLAPVNVALAWALWRLSHLDRQRGSEGDSSRSATTS